MIQEFCEWMVSTGELDDLVIGETLFAGEIPEDCNNALYTAVLERTGAVIDMNLTCARAKPLQLFTRGRTYHTARVEAHRLLEWLVVKIGIQLTTVYIYDISGAVEPAYLGKSAKGESEWSSNVWLQLRKE